MSNVRKQGWSAIRPMSFLMSVCGLVGAFIVPVVAEAYNDPDAVSFTIEGCRNPSVDLEATDFICADGDYTTGNLGKTWNELDLVPHRVTAAAGHSAPSTQTYTIAIVADYQDGSMPGYDVMSVPVLNLVHSTSAAACQFSVVDPNQQLQVPGLGGIDVSMYRMLTITQPKGSSCVFDYYVRLAVGSHLFPGSSLHSNLANYSISTSGMGARDVSIPVKEILPQELNKDMDAKQDIDFMWNLTKGPTPASINFGDTCAEGSVRSAPVAIRVEWQKLAAAPGLVNVLTNIYATNPAARTVQVCVTDNIRSGETSLSVSPTTCADVPANTEMLVVTNRVVVANGTTNLNDIATASYVDAYTGVEVPGNTNAYASAPIGLGLVRNNTAIVYDREWITGPGLSFSVDSTSGASGAFGGYVLGTQTTGPVDWTSGTQSGDGYVVFNKTIYLAGPAITSGALSDTARVVGSDGYETTAAADVPITADALTALTVTKEIPDILQGNETASFSFDVTGPNGYAQTVVLDFGASDTFKASQLTGLAPGAYVVSERQTALWNTHAPIDVSLALPTCAGQADFINTIPPTPPPTVHKTTLPAGDEAGWLVTLTGPNGSEMVATDSNGDATFSLALVEGIYTITEEVTVGWEQTGATGCTFTIDYPASGGQQYTCNFENTKLGRIKVRKQTLPRGAGQSFSFASSYGEPFELTDGQGDASGLLRPGTYSVGETVPTGWQQISASCDDGSVPSAIALAPGEEVTCTFVNREYGKIIVKKLTTPASDQRFAFDATFGAFDLANGEQFDSGNLARDFYSVNEVNLPADWDLTSASCDDGSAPGKIWLEPGEVVTCTFSNTQRGKIIVTKHTEPAGSAQSFQFTPSYGTAFNLADGQSNQSAWLQPGTYSVAEGALAGWELIGATCDDGSNPAAISLQAGETVRCSFANRQDGRIIINKVTDPVGAPDSFSFTSSFNGGFALAGGQNFNSGFLRPGSYSVAEGAAGPDWDLVSSTCSDGSAPGAIALAAGEVVTCTFVNVKRGHILVEKQTLPDGATQSFGFTATWGVFALSDGQFVDSGALVNGVYQVSEAAVAGWDLIGASCSDGSLPGAINLAPGETVRCIFTNQQRGRIIVSKATLPAGSPQRFVFTSNFVGTFQLGDGMAVESADLLPGTYAVSEAATAGWDLVSAVCSDGSAPGAIGLAPGEVVSCLFTNQQRGGATLLKLFNGSVDPNKNVTFTLAGQGVNLSRSTYGDVDGVLDFGSSALVAGNSYTMCEYTLPAGWSSTWQIDGGAVSPYNPNASDVPAQDLGVRCVDFTVAPGQVASFVVHNDYPNGSQRTIGYWKNWSTCTGGQQVRVAAANGGPAAGYYLLDNVLPLTIGLVTVSTCPVGVAILDKSDLSGHKRASDAGYGLAAQLLAAKANIAAGAGSCAAASTAITNGQALLVQIGFKATGAYLPSNTKAVALRNAALSLASTLDLYNNSLLCH